MALPEDYVFRILHSIEGDVNTLLALYDKSDLKENRQWLAQITDNLLALNYMVAPRAKDEAA